MSADGHLHSSTLVDLPIFAVKKSSAVIDFSYMQSHVYMESINDNNVTCSFVTLIYIITPLIVF